MKTDEISDLFQDGGLLICPSEPQERLAALDRAHLIALFEHHGVLLFRGFALDPQHISSFTDRFTERYAPDAVRRAPRFGQPIVHDVDHGRSAIPLHSEASFAATWPEIVWFYCNIPPRAAGCTTLSDGLQLWRHLSEGTQSLFLAQPLRYRISIPMGETLPGKGSAPWVSTTPGITGYLNWAEGAIDLTVLRYAVHESRLRRGGSLAFVNHLLCRREPHVRDLTMADGAAIPPDTFAEIEDVGERLTFDVQWQPRDVLMIDNKRFMHGRRMFAEGVERDIVQIQSERAGFAYGTTTRRPRA
jgi:alpha-ketoglutarate-dependent taurine dioxygenase